MVGQNMELEEDQRTALRRGSRQVRQAALLRSVNPESFRAAEVALDNYKIGNKYIPGVFKQAILP